MVLKQILDKLTFNLYKFLKFHGLIVGAMLPMVMASCEGGSEKLSKESKEQKVSKCIITKHRKYNVIEFSPQAMKMGVSLHKPSKADFYINSNFFDKKPIGLVVVKGKKINSRVNGGGYFYVKDGLPNISVKSCPKVTEFASQTILWGIDDGALNYTLFAKHHAREKEYRTIFGKTTTGNFLIVASNNKGLVSIQEITRFAYDLGMVEGVLFDGGSSVDYKFFDKKETVAFKSVNGLIKQIGGIHEPMAYIFGNYQ